MGTFYFSGNTFFKFFSGVFQCLTPTLQILPAACRPLWVFRPKTGERAASQALFAALPLSGSTLSAIFTTQQGMLHVVSQRAVLPFQSSCTLF